MQFFIITIFVRHIFYNYICDMFFHSIRFKVYKLAVGRQPFLFQIRSCFKFIPRQIETYVEADWSPRYAVNSGLLTKIKGF